MSAVETKSPSASNQAIESGVLAAYGARAIANGSAADDLPEVRENSYMRELDAAIVEGEARLGALAADLGSNHPTYRQQLAENAARREQREAEARRVVASASLVAEQSRAQSAADLMVANTLDGMHEWAVVGSAAGYRRVGRDELPGVVVDAIEATGR